MKSLHFCYWCFVVGRHVSEHLDSSVLGRPISWSSKNQHSEKLSQAKLLFLLQAYILDQAIHLINQALTTGMRFEQSKSHVASKDPAKNKASSGTVKQTRNIQIQVKRNIIVGRHWQEKAIAFLQIVFRLVWNQN